MRIAIVGSGPTGLVAARLLGEDPRHVITVFETRARFGGCGDTRLIAECVYALTCLGVTLRRTAQVERLAVGGSRADLWIHGLAERFDLALVATSPAEARALLVRSGLRRQAGSAALARRVYFAEHGSVNPAAAARSALVRMAADHRGVDVPPPPRDRHVVDVLRSLARRAGDLTAPHVQYLDLSGQTWPLGTPAVYIANQRWIVDAATRHLIGRSLRAPETPSQARATVDHLQAGGSVAFVVEGRLPAHGRAPAAPHGRGAALAALAVHAPMVPIVANGRPERGLSRPRARVPVVIGEPFYPETSSVDELLDHMRSVVRYLERLSVEEAAVHAPT